MLRETASAPLVLLTTDIPVHGSAGAEALKHVTGPKKPVHAVIEMLKQSGWTTYERFTQTSRTGETCWCGCA